MTERTVDSEDLALKLSIARAKLESLRIRLGADSTTEALAKIDKLEEDRDRWRSRAHALEGALAGLLDAPSVAPESCFNTSHQGTLQEDCSDCETEAVECRKLQAARKQALDVLDPPKVSGSNPKEG